MTRSVSRISGISSNWHRVFLTFSVAGVVAVNWGCRQEASYPGLEGGPKTEIESPSGSATAQTISGEEATPSAAIPLNAVGLQYQNVPDDPLADGWQTEAFNDAATAQLNSLGKLLASNRAPQPESVARFVDQDFRCGPLRPARLAVVFDDSALRVSRPPSGFDRATTQHLDFRGSKGFARALTNLLGPLADTESLRAKFKLYHVDLKGRGVITTVHVHFSGRTRAGLFQQSAVWACKWNLPSESTSPKLLSVALVDYEETLGRERTGPLFSDCTEAVLAQNECYQRQLAFGLNHWLTRLELTYGIIATSYHGLAVGDVNGDGLDDVYLCQPGGVLGGLPNRLFVQQPDGTARDVSAEAQVDWLLETHSALFVDLDNDGDQDLVVATVAGIIIAANDGSGTFQTKSLRLTPEAPPISLSAVDFDNDGDLDIYAGCYARRVVTGLSGRPVPYHNANNGGRNVLLRNDRDWRFTNVTKKVGLDQNNRRFSLACAWEDYDNDGDQDLYVANDFGRNNLYRNDQGQFKDVANAVGVEDISAGMSVSWGDYNNNGSADLYVGNMWSSAGNRVAYQRQFLHSTKNEKTRAVFQRHARGNSLFSNVAGPQGRAFQDISVEAHVTMGRWAWSSQFVDINNDGWQDLLVANGYITQDDTSDL